MSVDSFEVEQKHSLYLYCDGSSSTNSKCDVRVLQMYSADLYLFRLHGVKDF